MQFDTPVDRSRRSAVCGTPASTRTGFGVWADGGASRSCVKRPCFIIVGVGGTVIRRGNTELEEHDIWPSHMDKDRLTGRALANGWRMLGGFPSLAKPTRPTEAIVRMVLKATVAIVEVKKPAGKWGKLASAAYAQIQPDPETGVPGGLGLLTIPGLTKLMQDNKDRMVFGGTGSSEPAEPDIRSVFGRRRS